MKVNWIHYVPTAASVRLRSHIPAMYLDRMGVDIGNGDIFVAQKHNFKWAELPSHKKLVFDICDDHFSDHLQDHYRYGCEIADAVTCNSEVMQDIIKKETGRDAKIIAEPYESDERKASIGYKLIWFGHASNLVDIERLMPSLKQPLTILSNHENYPKWTPTSFAREMEKDCIVVIPTGKSMAKSENRMVESIRNGKIVCSEFLPAYKPFYEFFHTGDIPTQIDKILSNPADAIKRIESAQEYIRDRYSPETIAKQWLNLFESL